ncbi:WD40 repeat domain-containing protein [Verrucomicrobiota bacterium]
MRLVTQRSLLFMVLLALTCGCGERDSTNSKTEVTAAPSVELPQAKIFTGPTKTGCFCVAVSSDGSLLAAGYGGREPPYSIDCPVSGCVYVWSIKTQKVKCILRGHTEIVSSVDFSSDGRFLLSGSQDGSTRLWNIESGKEIRVVEQLHPAAPVTAIFMPDGKSILTANGGEGPMKGVGAYDVESGKMSGRFSKDTGDVAVNGDGSVVVTASGWAHVWEGMTGTKKTTFKAPGTIWQVALSPDGNTLVTGNSEGVVSVHNLATGSVEHRALHSEEATGKNLNSVESVAISRDGVWGASAGYGRICVWRLSDNETHFWDTDNWVQDVTFGPTGNTVYAGSRDGQVVTLTPPNKAIDSDTK